MADKHNYWKGHEIKDDAKLVRDLFYGRVVRRQKRTSTKFPDSSREGTEALGRLLGHGLRRSGYPAQADEFSEALVTVILALDPDSVAPWNPRKLKIEFRKQRRSDFAADMQIMLHVENLRPKRGEKEAAIQSAIDKFGMHHRSAVFKAIGRAKAHLKKLGLDFP